MCVQNPGSKYSFDNVNWGMARRAIAEDYQRLIWGPAELLNGRMASKQPVMTQKRHYVLLVLLAVCERLQGLFRGPPDLGPTQKTGIAWQASSLCGGCALGGNACP